MDADAHAERDPRALPYGAYRRALADAHRDAEPGPRAERDAYRRGIADAFVLTVADERAQRDADRRARAAAQHVARALGLTDEPEQYTGHECDAECIAAACAAARAAVLGADPSR